MIRTWRRIAGVGLIAALFITACAATNLTSSWKDPAYVQQPRKIMVIAIAKKALNKRIIEDEFVAQLKARGTPAVASYAFMPDEKQNDHARIASTMREQGADAVLISRLMRKKTVYIFVPGRISYPPSYYSNWRDYYGYGAQAVYTPGYTAEDEYAIMETNLYDAGNDKLIWSASSETEIQGTRLDQIRSYVDVMMNAMAGQRLIQ